jgi:hypothetical protein
MGASARGQRNIAQTFWAALGGRLGHRLALLHPRQQGIQGQNDGKIDGDRDDQKGDGGVEKVADFDLTAAQMQNDGAEIRLADGGDETIALKAAPIITATARSTTLPRKMKLRNPLSISLSLRLPARIDSLNGSILDGSARLVLCAV